MTNISTEIPKQNLFAAIDSLLDDRSLFLTNPHSDFTRVKKIPFRQTILFPMTAGSDNTATELIDAFNEEDIPLPSVRRIQEVHRQVHLSHIPRRHALKASYPEPQVHRVCIL